MEFFIVALWIVAILVLIPSVVMVGSFATVLILDEPYTQRALVRISGGLIRLSVWLSMLKVSYKHAGRHRLGEVRRVTNAELVGARWGWAHCT